MRALILAAALFAAPLAAQTISVPVTAPAASGVSESTVDQKIAAALANRPTIADVQAMEAAVAAQIPSMPDLSPYALKTQVPSLTGYATTSSVASQISAATAGMPTTGDVTSAITAATSGMVRQVNGTTPVSGNVTIPLPTASTTAPPGVADSGAAGTTTMVYALANHTHASKVRKFIATSAADGSYTFNYSSAPFSTAPMCVAMAEVAAGVTDVVNVQLVGTPTTTSASFLVNRSQRSTQILNLVSITLLAIQPTPGATKIHGLCVEL